MNIFIKIKKNVFFQFIYFCNESSHLKTISYFCNYFTFLFCHCFGDYEIMNEFNYGSLDVEEQKGKKRVDSWLVAAIII